MVTLRVATSGGARAVAATKLMAELAIPGAKLAVGVLAPAGGMVKLTFVAVATMRPVEALARHSETNTKAVIFD